MEDSFDPGDELHDSRSYGDFSVSTDSEQKRYKSCDLLYRGDVSLRTWLDDPRRSVTVPECVHVFRQIMNIVRVAHYNGIVVHNIRPSCFIISSHNRVSFVESGSESAHLPVDFNGIEIHSSYYGKQDGSDGVEEGGYNEKVQIPLKWMLDAEVSWYMSPEEVEGVPASFASDIYRLGVFLFEMFSGFSSRVEKMKDMYLLKEKSVPPIFMRKWPEEAETCLWMLHSDPNCRPTMGDLLKIELLNKRKENVKESYTIADLGDKIEDEEVLLEFLFWTLQRKEENASMLKDAISTLSADIIEVGERQVSLIKEGVHSHNDDHIEQTVSTVDYGEKAAACFNSIPIELHKPEFDAVPPSKPNFSEENFGYMLEKSKHLKSSTNEKSSERNKQNDWITPLLDSFGNYFPMCKLRLNAELNQRELLNPSSLICSISFDRDGDLFATAGVNKKIKIFEYEAVIKEKGDIHYPTVEMASTSKLIGTCWNGYVKSQLASCNFNGVVQVWDVTRGELVDEMREHDRRVWSIDFSTTDPTLLASGSDDCTVKLWSINQGVISGSINAKANVCGVQFHPDTSQFLAFGCADHKIYYYDRRNLKAPLYVLNGHSKTVSSVKFLDSTCLVSASTDNTIKLWDVSTSCSQVRDATLSLSGHLNIKNFVGLSVSDGYISTGSETNEVFIYHKQLPRPVMSMEFGGGGDGDGDGAETETAHFVSSVCWRPHTTTLAAANSAGRIRILEII